MSRKVDHRPFDTLQQRMEIPLLWALTIVAVLIVGVFAATWLAGSSLWMVGVSTLAAAFLAPIGLAILGTALRYRLFDIVAHVVLGLSALFVALLVTLLSAAEGALTLSPGTLVVGTIWVIGIALVLAGVFVFVDAPRRLRLVATLGLGVTAVWGLIVAVIVGELVVDIVFVGVDESLVQDLRDDLVPILAVFVSLVVLPSLVFVRDLQESRKRSSNEC
ncbi:hypothetical protein [Haladaptatus sp. NG-WS-4]